MFLDWIINTFFVKKFEKTDKGIEKAFNYLVEKLEKNGINKFLK